jgi:N-acetylneuraminic acid mutarotase
VWIFSGQRSNASGSELLNDLWTFNPATHAWTKVNQISASDASGNPALPAPRTAAATWVDASGSLWLFGGLGTSGSGQPLLLNDLWKFVPSTGEWLQPAASATPATASPPPRMSATSWVDADGDLWLFGGTALAPAGEAFTLADLWRYSPNAQSWAPISDRPQ